MYVGKFGTHFKVCMLESLLLNHTKTADRICMEFATQIV